MNESRAVRGESFHDHRGSLRFFNQFNMQEIVRFYEISPANTELIRGWQGHRIEKKWFYCTKGSFIINVVSMDDHETPSNSVIAAQYLLKESLPEVLFVPKNHATAIKAIKEDAKLQVYSNFTLEESKNDDLRFPLEKWTTNWEI
ncbi:MAG: WxcM-like domain-containing protein [Bacteroidota bacterium]